MELTTTLPVSPSMVICSGHGLHFYWLLEEPFELHTEDRRLRFEHIVKGLTDYLHGDMGATDSSRIMRLPGTTNTKSEPVECEVLGNLVSDPPRYSVEDFEDFEARGRLLSVDREPAEDYEAKEWGSGVPAPAQRAIMASRVLRVLFTRAEGQRDESDADFHAACLLAEAGISMADAEHALRYRRERVGAKPHTWKDYFKTTIRKAYGKQEQAPPEPEPTESSTEEEPAVSAFELAFAPENMTVEFAFDTKPEPLEFLVEGFFPAKETALLVGPGGAGKGFWQMELARCLVLGEPFGPHKVVKPRGVLMISLEDDRLEFHRRLTAMLDYHYNGHDEVWRRDLLDVFMRRMLFVSGCGISEFKLGDLSPLRGAIYRAVESHLEEPGLIMLDPLGRLLPAGAKLNDQAAAADLITAMDAIRVDTGAAVLAAHHANKAARKEGEMGNAVAATGSAQLVDLVRLVVNLWDPGAEEYPEEEHGSEFGYARQRAVKSNRTRSDLSGLWWRREEGGVLSYCPVASKQGKIENWILDLIELAGHPLPVGVIRDKMKADHSTSRRPVDAALTSMVGEEILFKKVESNSVLYGIGGGN
jgi:hypothetical protein